MKSPAFQFYPDDFVGGVADMTQAEVGAYILLLCAQWGRGEIPLDPDRAALIAKGPVSPHVLAKFPHGKNARLEKVRANLENYRDAQAANGKAGASKRWGSHSGPNGVAIAPPSPKHSDPIVSPMARNSSPSPSPSPDSDSVSHLPQSGGRSVYPSVEEWCAVAKQLHPEWPETDVTGAWNYYEARGWRSGKSTIRNWRAAIRTCYGNWQKASAPKNLRAAPAVPLMR